MNESEIRPAAIVVGCGDVGSAVAHALHRAGCAVVLASALWVARGYQQSTARAMLGAYVAAPRDQIPMERVLSGLKRGELVATPEFFDAMYTATDGLSRILARDVGESSQMEPGLPSARKLWNQLVMTSLWLHPSSKTFLVSLCFLLR